MELDKLNNVDEDLQELLEDDSVEQRSPVHIVDVDAPAGLGRSEYKKMLDDLWGEGDNVRMTDFERGLDLADESLDAIAHSISRLYGQITSAEIDSKDMGVGALGTVIGTLGFVGSAAFTAMETGFDYMINRLEIGSHTHSDGVYESENSGQRTARVFYTEEDDRYLTFAPPRPGEELDTELVQEAVEYINQFEA